MARARALTGLEGIRYWQGVWTGNLDSYEEALALFRTHGSDADVAESLYNLSFPVGYMGDVERAEELLHESLGISERIGRTIGVGRAYWGIGDLATVQMEFARSIEHMEKAIDVFSGIDAPFDLGWAWFMLAFSNEDGQSQGGLGATAPRN